MFIIYIAVGVGAPEKTRTPHSGPQNELSDPGFHRSSSSFYLRRHMFGIKKALWAKPGWKVCLCVCCSDNPPHSACTYVVPRNGFRRLFRPGIASLHSVCFAMLVNKPFWWIRVEGAHCCKGQHISLEMDLFCRARLFLAGLDSELCPCVCLCVRGLHIKADIRLSGSLLIASLRPVGD